MKLRSRYRSPDVVSAVHEHDLEAFLRSLGILEALLAGRVSCAICGRLLALHDVGCVYPIGDEIRVACDAAECLAAVGRQTGAV